MHKGMNRNVNLKFVINAFYKNAEAHKRILLLLAVQRLPL